MTDYINCSNGQPCTMIYATERDHSYTVGDIIGFAVAFAIVAALVPFVLSAAWAICYHHVTLRRWYEKKKS